MITDKDADKLVEKFKRIFATKVDLEKELQQFTTKADLEELEIRVAKSFDQNQQQMTGMRQDISKLQGNVSGLQENVSKLQEDVSEIKHNMLTMEDNIIGAINKLQIENSITASYRPKIENHEQRIVKLEKSQFAN